MFSRRRLAYLSTSLIDDDLPIVHHFDGGRCVAPGNLTEPYSAFVPSSRFKFRSGWPRRLTFWNRPAPWRVFANVEKFIVDRRRFSDGALADESESRSGGFQFSKVDVRSGSTPTASAISCTASWPTRSAPWPASATASAPSAIVSAP